jgi:MtN3 and saliva related transmembrane protein
MEIDALTILGLIAATLTTGALVPQAVKTWQTRSAGDLSLGMYVMLFTGTACWLAYGILKSDLPLIFANGIGFCLSFSILLMKLRQK